MSKPQDIFGASTPKTALNKPMFHVQDQKAYNVDGGTSVADTWTSHDLNTVIINQIPGASLGSNSVNLPAGTYYIEGQYCLSDPGTTQTAGIAGIFKDGSKMLQGPTITTVNSPMTYMVPVSGIVTMASSGVISLKYYIGQAVVTGLGASNNSGSITDATISSIYSDLKIWQLDTTVQTPVLVSDKLYPLPGNCMVTGNMHGLEYVRNGNNQISIYPGICMDSLNTTMLTLSAQQNLNLPTTINAIFNLFLCSDGVVRYDTDVNGANLTSYKIRWIGFVRNNVSGTLDDQRLIGNQLFFINPLTISSTLSATTYTIIDFSTFISIPRIISIVPYFSAGVGQGVTTISSDGINALYDYGDYERTQVSIPIFNNGFYYKVGSGTRTLKIVSCLIKR